VIGIPVIALLALTRTDLLPNSSEPLAVVSAMIVLGSGFTSPAISIAFERRYGSYAFLGTTPMPRSAIIAGTIVAIAISALIASFVIGVLTPVVQAGVDPTALARFVLATLLGLLAVVPWAFVLAGTARAESVLVIANAIFVIAIVFGGVLIPAESLPYGAALTYLPSGAVTEVAQVAQVTQSTGAGTVIAPVLALLGWALAGTALATRVFRWR
jgi:ABC-2 type transport system permease protein